MSTQSGHNISLSKSKFGCRFPFERPDAGDGYAASSPVTARQMTPEERAKYGPAKSRPRTYTDKISAEKVTQALDEAESVEEAAKALNMHPQRLKLRMAELGIKREKEESKVAAFETYPDKKPAKSPQPDKPKSQEKTETVPSVNENTSDQGEHRTVVYPQITEEIYPKHDKVSPVSDEDKVSWVTPRKSTHEIPIIRFFKDGISFNVHAQRTLQASGVKFMRIGARGGAIVIAKSDQEGGAFKLSYQKDGSGKIGGGNLVNTLKSQGVKYGRYRLERNEARGWWEARADGQV